MDRKKKFDISALGKREFRPSGNAGSALRGVVALPEPVPPAAMELLRTFKGAPRKPLLVSEIAAAAGRSPEASVDVVIGLVKAGSLDLLQRAEGGNHLVSLTAHGRSQVEAL